MGGFELIGEGAAKTNLLRLPPRAVPRPLVWRLQFAHVLGIGGWVTAAAGFLACLIVLPMADVNPPDYDRKTQAAIADVEDSGAEENGSPIYRVHYTFVDEGGVARRGVSYTKDSAVHGNREVEYVAADPDQSRLVGMRSKPIPALVALILLLPLIGLGIAAAQIVRGRRAVRLLRFGVETRGKLIRKTETNLMVNERPVMALTFEYEVDGKAYRSVSRTTDPTLLEDDALEPMLYDPRRPSRATTLDHLPGKPAIDPDGKLRVVLFLAFWPLILPIVTAAMAVATALVLLG
jgi:hypothetical protein